MIRALMMPGIAHANDPSNGMNDLPCSPNSPITLSTKNAARARYPHSSRMEINKFKIKICGKNTITDPTPPRSPFTRNDLINVGSMESTKAPCSTPMPPSIRSISGSAHVKIDWKKNAMITINASVPHTG